MATNFVVKSVKLSHPSYGTLVFQNVTILILDDYLAMKFKKLTSVHSFVFFSNKVRQIISGSTRDLNFELDYITSKWTSCQVEKLLTRHTHTHQCWPLVTHVKLSLYQRRLCHISNYGNITSSTKPEVHNVLERSQRRTEPRTHGICVENFVKYGRVIPEMLAYRQTDRRAHGNIPLPYRGQID